MTTLIGALTLASAVFSLLLGQVTAGFEFFGVMIASLLLMTVRI
jgi:hypothetical protein